MNILVVSPHPDDETLGAGGSLFKLKEQGNKLYWLNITDVSREDGYDPEFIAKRRQQIADIYEKFEFEKMFNLKMSPTKLSSYPQEQLIDRIAGVFDEVKPAWLLLPDYNDAHSDHKCVFEACYACSKVFRRSFIKRILTMEIISETDFGKPYDVFKPNLYMDITDYFSRKIEAVSIYDTELGKPPFPRSLEAVRVQALRRGIEAGVMYAEAFRVLKEIE